MTEHALIKGEGILGAYACSTRNVLKFTLSASEKYLHVDYNIRLFLRGERERERDVS